MPYFDARDEQTLRERSTLMTGYNSESTVDSEASANESSSDSEFGPSPAAAAAHAHPLPATTEESDEDRQDFNFDDSPSSTAATQGYTASSLNSVTSS